ncbi:hypothetical protein GGS21DRAFT_541300 [Xylaria nigripes]|nr:hypothetical protein GGS21DRAFT_541300 [Xylaria nigripes]
MASSSANADTLINVKVSLDGGATRRFRLPLRDLGVNVFENRLRNFLQIPVDTITTIERYSDSATSYVTLENTNIAVYKQLYRAAKAKQKLRLRVTTKPLQPVNGTQPPRPVTIEDEPEEKLQTIAQHETQEVPGQELEQESEQQSNEEPEPEVQNDEPVVPPANDAHAEVCHTVLAPRNSEEFASFIRIWRARGKPRFHLRPDANNVQVIDFLGPKIGTEPLISFERPAGLSQGGSITSFARVMRDACGKQLIASNLSEEDLVEIKNLWSRFASIPAPPGHNSIEGDKSQTLPFEMRLARQIPCAQVKVDSKESSEPLAPVMEKTEEAPPTEVVEQPEPHTSSFTVCCNSCDHPVPDTHFHCSICDDGDFDLCQNCVNRGISCHVDGHWLIKRTIVDGRIECSSTEVIPKLDRSSATKVSSPPTRPSAIKISSPLVAPCIISLPTRCRVEPSSFETKTNVQSRTCNCCVREFPDEEFVHCTTCEDYDLCKSCFVRDQHGHDPKHGFDAAVKDTVLDYQVLCRLSPGRNVPHNAICDGCDKYIRGIRHKCLDCPDWDYCSECIKNASMIHPSHRFAIIYDALADRYVRASLRATHEGITCDGPLCSHGNVHHNQYIVGERYKCAVCHDTDFCANCEAHPANPHNKTHPLIKFKTPVRHVSVTTTGEHEDGKRLPTMGDRCPPARATTQSPGKSSWLRDDIVATPVQTVVDVQPTEQSQAIPPSSNDGVEVKKEATEIKTTAVPESCNLVAIFKWDTIKDGSVLPPNHTFEQTWVLRNEGTVSWPAGCSVKFVGGDYMGAVDPARPAGIRELISASESTVCYDALNPGEEFPFTVLMRTPDRDGKIISYWRLTTPDGVKFGHKLWCDVTVQAPPKLEQVKPEILDAVEAETGAEETKPAALTESRMIIPTLEHESPVVSVHKDQSELEVENEADTLAPSTDEDDGFEDCGGHEDWADESGDSFLTDEEYDILDASDEEFLFEQQKTLPKK